MTGLSTKSSLLMQKKEADLIYCGKLPNYHTMRQETINKFLVKYAQAGKIVTRLKGGDPYLFGRGGGGSGSIGAKTNSF